MPYVTALISTACDLINRYAAGSGGILADWPVVAPAVGKSTVVNQYRSFGPMIGAIDRAMRCTLSSDHASRAFHNRQPE